MPGQGPDITKNDSASRATLKSPDAIFSGFPLSRE